MIMKLWNCGNEQCAIAETGNWDATTILVPRWPFPKFHNCTFLIGLLGDSDDIPLLSRFASDFRRALAVEAEIKRIKGREEVGVFRQGFSSDNENQH